MSLLIDNLDSLGVIGERFHNRREQNTFSRFNISVRNGKNNVLRERSLDFFVCFTHGAGLRRVA